MRLDIGKRRLRIKDCKGIKSARGLMFDTGWDGAMIYGNSIWMPFVNCDLLLVFLDEEMTVVEKTVAVPLTLNPKTWKVYGNNKAKYCLELKDTNLRIKKGMKIRLGL